jgi:hypothetical protein
LEIHGFILHQAPTTNVVADIDGDASTSMSCSADLILPAGSTIVKAYLAIEQGFAIQQPLVLSK